jgi:drug/metabolite transporter (DMT)-like permease
VILMLAASGGLLAYLIADSPASRKAAARFLIPLAALVLLALLLSINPKWVIFGALGVYAGACLWGVVRREHAEYLAEQERPAVAPAVVAEDSAN